MSSETKNVSEEVKEGLDKEKEIMNEFFYNRIVSALRTRENEKEFLMNEIEAIVGGNTIRISSVK